MNAIDDIIARAGEDKRRIVLPEGGDRRVVAAAGRIAERGIADVVVIGARDAVGELARTAGIDVGGFEVIDARDAESLALAVQMVANGEADGCVAGAAHTTADVVRAALQVVGVKRNDDDGNDGGGLVSSFFIMQHDLPHQAIHGAAIFADCALVVDPNAAQLARIAIDTADSAAALVNLKPRIALLSFSTAGSARHPFVDKVREAGEIVAHHRPDIELLPEVQFDAAVVPDILRDKAPAIHIDAGDAPANIFIFPDLQSANIGYKIAERIGGVRTVGPILQGLNRPVNDLSRGCDIDDIVGLVAVTALQARE